MCAVLESPLELHVRIDLENSALILNGRCRSRKVPLYGSARVPGQNQVFTVAPLWPCVHESELMSAWSKTNNWFWPLVSGYGDLFIEDLGKGPH